MNNEKKEFLEGLSQDFKRLREDKTALKHHEDEMKCWDNTLSDFLLNSPLKNSKINLSRSKEGSGRNTIKFKRK